MTLAEKLDSAVNSFWLKLPQGIVRVSRYTWRSWPIHEEPFFWCVKCWKAQPFALRIHANFAEQCDCGIVWAGRTPFAFAFRDIYHRGGTYEEALRYVKAHAPELLISQPSWPLYGPRRA